MHNAGDGHGQQNQSYRICRTLCVYYRVAVRIQYDALVLVWVWHARSQPLVALHQMLQLCGHSVLTIVAVLAIVVCVLADAVSMAFAVLSARSTTPQASHWHVDNVNSEQSRQLST